jgi:hypothetical protein
VSLLRETRLEMQQQAEREASDIAWHENRRRLLAKSQGLVEAATRRAKSRASAIEKRGIHKKKQDTLQKSGGRSTHENEHRQEQDHGKENENQPQQPSNANKHTPKQRETILVEPRCACSGTHPHAAPCASCACPLAFV